jgi:hypothetical protein
MLGLEFEVNLEGPLEMVGGTGRGRGRRLGFEGPAVGWGRDTGGVGSGGDDDDWNGENERAIGQNPEHHSFHKVSTN